MLDFLRRRDHRRIARGVVVDVAHHLLAFLDETLHTLARLAARRHVQLLEDLFETFDLLFGLLQMFFDCLSQLFTRSLLRHLRQRFRELLLGVVDVFQFVVQEIAERFKTGHTVCLPRKKTFARAETRRRKQELCAREPRQYSNTAALVRHITCSEIDDAK